MDENMVVPMAEFEALKVFTDQLEVEAVSELNRRDELIGQLRMEIGEINERNRIDMEEAKL